MTTTVDARGKGIRLSATGMRVPFITGLLARVSGSTTMRSPYIARPLGLADTAALGTLRILDRVAANQYLSEYFLHLSNPLNQRVDIALACVHVEGRAAKRGH